MALPPVHGWIIDYRTADAIFLSGSNIRINHCITLCQTGLLHVCHCEEGKFRASHSLKGPFISSQCCVFEPDEEILERCLDVKGNPVSDGLLTGNEAALFMTATALTKDFGVISDHRSPKFATVYDLCNTYGVPIFSADQYFDALP